MTAEEAYAEAERRIAENQRLQVTHLDLGDLPLDRLPPALAKLSHLEALSLGESEIVTGVDGELAFDCDKTRKKLICTDHTPRSSSSTIRSIRRSRPKRAYTDLSSLSELRQLRLLDLSRCHQLSDLGPLYMLAELHTLHLWNTAVSDIGPLVGLTALRILDLSSCRGVSDTGPLAGLTGLHTLHLSGTGVSDIGPLAGLSGLRTLHLSGTGVSDIGPLVRLTCLHTLILRRCKGLSDIGPLAALAGLHTLDLRETGVSDVSPLAGLTSLHTLRLASCRLTIAPLQPLIGTLTVLDLDYARILDLPWFICGHEHFRNSKIHTLRAYYGDLDAGTLPDRELKLFVLGNGRIGKTQLVRRLRGQQFDPDEATTHGVRLTELEFGETRLNVWDFGGQDLYHGSHALFLHGQAVFALLWTPETENEEPAEDAGIVIRNRRLDYWWDYLRAAVGRRNPDGKWVVEAPVLLIQSQCESKRDERPPPVLPDRDEFPNLYMLSFAARTDRNLGTLRDSLTEALDELRRRQQKPPLGRGWVEVRSQLRAMQAVPADRRTRTLTLDEFRVICERSGGVSDPGVLLTVLHWMGVVFYESGLFGDRVIVDQSWALDAIYTVFHRQRATPYLMRSGRFTRAVLGELVWNALGHAPADQDTFLSMMEQCGICFRLRWLSGNDSEYLAPDLLPEAEPDLTDRIPGEPDVSAVADFPFLHDGLLRRFLSRIGGHAQDRAEYWRYGCYFYEATTRSRVRVRSRRPSDGSSRGTVTVDAWGPAAGELAEQVLRMLTHGHVGPEPTVSRSDRVPVRDRRTHRDDDADMPIVVEAEPYPRGTVFLSYAHGVCDDEVVQLADTLRVWGYDALLDRERLSPGDCIRRFMVRAGTAARVVVVLGPKYLRSTYCLTELFEVYLRCGRQPDEFRQRVLPIVLPDARVYSADERADHGRHWRRQAERLADPDRRDDVGIRDRALSVDMRWWADALPDILGLIADTLHPVGFDQARMNGYAAVRRLLEK